MEPKPPAITVCPPLPAPPHENILIWARNDPARVRALCASLGFAAPSEAPRPPAGKRAPSYIPTPTP